MADELRGEADCLLLVLVLVLVLAVCVQCAVCVGYMRVLRAACCVTRGVEGSGREGSQRVFLDLC